MTTEDAPQLYLTNAVAQLREREDYSDAEISVIAADAHRKAMFDALYEAKANETEKRNAVVKLRAEEKRLQAVVTLAEIALHKLVPKRNFYSLWKTDIGKVEPNPIYDTEAVKVAQRDLELAQEAVQTNYAETRAAANAVIPAENRTAYALKAYYANYPLMTPAQNYRQHLKTQHDQRVAIAEGRVIPKEQAAPASALDAQLSGYRGQPGQRYNQARRGAFDRSKYGQTVAPAAPAAPKLPSQR